MYIRMYGEVRKEDVLHILRDIKKHTQADTIEDAIQLAFCDEEYSKDKRHQLKLLKMLYSAAMDGFRSIDVLSMYQTV